MSNTGIPAFDSTLQTTNVWFNDLNEMLQWNSHLRAYHAFRAVLHALRDRLGVDEAAALGAQLPLLVRGFYYEGWHPSKTPVKDRTVDDFLAHIKPAFRDDPGEDVERITRAVFRVVARHVSLGETASIRRCLPAELRELWN